MLVNVSRRVHVKQNVMPSVLHDGDDNECVYR